MSTLENIVRIKREKINLLKSSNNFTDHFITNNTKQYKQSFFDNLRNSTDKYKIIAEIKKGSPSAGIILDDFDPLLCAKQYIEKGYKNLSVLTEEDHFFGSHLHIESIKKHHDIPILQKDFVIDEWQIYQAKIIGVDCILLIAEILTETEIKDFIQLAKSLKLDILLEFHSENELMKVVDQDVNYLGINNRNLHTLITDINHCLTIRNKYEDVLKRFTIVAESGFNTVEDLERYRSDGIDMFLIGESLLKEKL